MHKGLRRKSVGRSLRDDGIWLDLDAHLITPLCPRLMTDKMVFPRERCGQN